ncbi:hypothetical protein ACFVT5_22115 [Streptomyces sp. NPDC058001]|uniref:hypothetical protein n=1 Tax=Streptomyces sp. NPDC058001 TaxID=3346300 RepID=UPI0036E3ED3F
MDFCSEPGAGPVFHHATLPRVRLGDVYDWVREYGYPVRRLPLAHWREQLPRSGAVAATTLAFFDSAEQAAPIDLRLGHVQVGNVRAGLEGSGITCPPVDRDLVFGYVDHCVTAGVLSAPAGHRHSPATPGK